MVLDGETWPMSWTTENSESMTLSYFDPMRNTKIYIDVFPVWTCTVLTQQGSVRESAQVVQLASRALTPTEHYSQSGALAVTCAWGHFHVYVFGTQFVIFTDHRVQLSAFSHMNTHWSTVQGKITQLIISVSILYRIWPVCCWEWRTESDFISSHTCNSERCSVSLPTIKYWCCVDQNTDRSLSVVLMVKLNCRYFQVCS